jgi:hypothetical protein
MLPAKPMRTKAAGFISDPMGSRNSGFSYVFLKNIECVRHHRIGMFF